MITVLRYVVHEIKKEFKTKGAILESSEKLGAIDINAVSLVDLCHKSFTDSTLLKNTRFIENQSNVFHTGLTKYLNNKDINSDDKLFYDFSINAIKALKEDVGKEYFAVGGYYLFADYVYEDRRFLNVILLRKKSGYNFIKKGNTFIPGSAENLNIDKIAMGFRLNYGLYMHLENDKNYIGIITSSSDKLSTYFKDWVQAAGIVSDEKNSTMFLKVLNSIPLPKENGIEISRDYFKKAIYELTELDKNKQVNIFDLSSKLYGNENEQYIHDFIIEQNLIIDTEFKRNANVWKRLIMIKASIEGIELNINIDKLNANEVDIIDDTIIIRSAELIEQINQQRKSKEDEE